MKAKLRRYNHDGLPVSSNDWTEEDWRDLHYAIQESIHKIRERHQEEKNNGDQKQPRKI